MLLKTAILFLAAMVLIAFVGSRFFPGALTRSLKNGLTGGKAGRKTGSKAPRCSRCGRYLIGNGGCDCGKKG